MNNYILTHQGEVNDKVVYILKYVTSVITEYSELIKLRIQDHFFMLCSLVSSLQSGFKCRYRSNCRSESLIKIKYIAACWHSLLPPVCFSLIWECP